MTEKISFEVKGMVCDSCEKLIQRSVSKLDGVKSAKVSYTSGKAEVEFDSEKISKKKILSKVEDEGYICPNESANKNKKIFGWAFGILGVLVAGYFLFSFVDGIALPEINSGMGLGLLFLVGILTRYVHSRINGYEFLHELPDLIKISRKVIKIIESEPFFPLSFLESILLGGGSLRPQPTKTINDVKSKTVNDLIFLSFLKFIITNSRENVEFA